MIPQFCRRLWLWIFLLLYSLDASAFIWRADVDGAFKDAKEKNKPLFIYFYHPSTLKEDNKVFMSSLLKRFEERFISVQVDMTVHAEVAAKYKVSVFPSVLFFDPQGREIISLRYEDEKPQQTTLAVWMKRVLTEVEEFALLESKTGELKDKPEMLLMYAKGLRDRALFDQAEEHFNRLLQKPDLNKTLLQDTQKAYVEMLFLQATQAFYSGKFSQCIEIMQRVLDKYADFDVAYQAKFLMGMSKYESGNVKEGEKLLKELAKNKEAGIFKEKATMYLNQKKAGRGR